MAKLGAMPQKSIIDGFKGVIDFYIHKGVPCVRSWPRWTLTTRSPAVQAGNTLFTRVTQELQRASPLLIAAAKLMVAGSPQTWKDLMFAQMMGNEDNEMPE